MRRGKVRVERVPDLIVNLGRDLQVGREAAAHGFSGPLAASTPSRFVFAIDPVGEVARQLSGGELTPSAVISFAQLRVCTEVAVQWSSPPSRKSSRP